MHANQFDSWLSESEQRALARQPQWLALLHYKDEVWSTGFISQVDDERFFLSPHGKFDPAAELKADLAAFIKPAAPGHAQCLFPARWYWLKQQLSIDNAYDVSCPRFEKWAAAISTDSLSLIFPAMYLNNPGSSFGHTFIRFDNHQSALLSHALNYAASYKEADSLPKYIYNGLFGGYNGVFTLRHYFQTVEEYSNLENRDIWEYRLDYTQQEIQQLVRHVWEVSDIDFDYYFFSENCSYRLLALLDVLREDSTLTTAGKFPLYAIPVDTVRALDEAGVITNRHYRPSLASRLHQQLAALSSTARRQAVKLAAVEIDIQHLENQFAQQPATLAAIYDNAYNILEFQQQHHTEQAKRILSARSDIEIIKQPIQYDAISPEQGHASARFSMLAGRVDDEDFIGMRMRPAFHDLGDRPAGYVAGAEISIFQAELRWYEQQDLEFENLVFINMYSLSPLSDWHQPVSWLLDVRLQQQSATAFQLADNFISQHTQLGAGLTLDMSQRVLSDKLYALAVFDLQLADELHHGYSAQAGLQLGWLHYSKLGQIKLQLQSLYDVAGHEAEQDSLNLQYQYDVSNDLALRLNYQRQLYLVGDETEWSLELNVYF